MVSSDLSINGDLESSGELQIDGTTVADTVVIAGQFNGAIETREVVFANIQ